jgi:hypothetical protein
VKRLAMAACALAAALAACSSGPPFPAGWQPVPATRSVWQSGAGAARQTYAYSKARFDGTLQDLASREAVNIVLRYRGAKFKKSDVFGPCPGMAAIATFADGARTLQEGFTVQNGYAVTVLYARPAGAADDPAVTRAMQRTLCTAVL